MPELPEVETLCRQLNSVLRGGIIHRIAILDSRLRKTGQEREKGVASFPVSGPESPGVDQPAGLIGRRISKVTRRGKSIHLQMEGGMTAAIHLRMSGRLLYRPADTPPAGRTTPHCRMVVGCSSGTLLLIDPRRFATFTVNPEAKVPAIPDDPMDGLSARRLYKVAGTRRRSVKAFLMDQDLVAGIGNIYACEILFAAGIDPRRTAGSLKAAEWRKIAEAAPVILQRAVDCRGTTVSDWRDLFGRRGTNQDHLEVYAREGAPCRRCGGRIERINMGGRGTWICLICQK